MIAEEKTILLGRCLVLNSETERTVWANAVIREGCADLTMQ